MLSVGMLVSALLFAGWRQRLPYIIAGVLLVGFGFIWGQQSVVHEGARCVGGTTITGSIQSVYRLRASDAQYVVRDEQGCKALVTTTRFPVHTVGDAVAVMGETQSVHDMPEEYRSYGKYLQRRGIHQTVRYADIQTHASKVSFLHAVRSRLYTRIGEVFTEPEASIVQAMILGERGGIPDEVTEQFRRAGISHVLAISGLHISLLAGGLWVLLRSAPLSRKAGMIMSLVVLWGYIVMVGAAPSTLRAGLFWSVALLGRAVHALVSLPTLLILTLLALISAQPTVITDVGFQLSFAAVVGIGLALFLTRAVDRQRHHSFFRVVWDVVVVSIGASVSTWPLVAIHFGSISTLGVLANVLIVPAIPLFLGIAVVAVLMSWLFVPISYLGSTLVHVLWAWIDSVSLFVSRIPFSYVAVDISPMVAACYYILLIGASILIIHYQKRTWREVWQ